MGPEVLIAVLVPLAFFSMVFGIIYIRSRENMAMIEKGQNPRVKDTRPRPFINLKWGLLLVGSGLGLLLAYIIDNTLIKKDNRPTATTITIGRHHGTPYKKVVIATDANPTAKDTTVSKDTAAATNAPASDDEEDDDNNIEYRNNEPDAPALYFALIAIGGGIGLVLSYSIEKKHWLDKIKES